MLYCGVGGGGSGGGRRGREGGQGGQGGPEGVSGGPQVEDPPFQFQTCLADVSLEGERQHTPEGNTNTHIHVSPAMGERQQHTTTPHVNTADRKSAV